MPRIDSVEDRLSEIEKALALSALLSRSLGTAEMQLLGDGEMEARAWSAVADLCERAFHHSQLVQEVLPGSALNTRCPDPKEVA